MKGRPLSSAKREELTTYRELKLERTFKSKVQRQRAAGKGLYRILGGDDPTRPYIRVPVKRYLAVRAEVVKDMLSQSLKAELGVAADQLVAHLTPRIEARTYVLLADEMRKTARMETSFLERYGRHLTVEERARFGESLAAATTGPVLNPGAAQREMALDDIMAKVGARQKSNPARYRTAWVEAVGTEAALQSHLDRVDATTGTVYFRCLNGPLSSALKTRPEVLRKLSKALGINIRQLRSF